MMTPLYRYSIVQRENHLFGSIPLSQDQTNLEGYSLVLLLYKPLTIFPAWPLKVQATLSLNLMIFLTSHQGTTPTYKVFPSVSLTLTNESLQIQETICLKETISIFQFLTGVDMQD